MKKGLALVLVLLMCLAVAACTVQNKEPSIPQGSEENPQGNAAENTPAEETNSLATADLTKPEIVVELNDHEGMTDLMKKMSNMQVPEGTVIQVTGTLSRNTSTPSLMAVLPDGKTKLGISVFIDDTPDENTPAEGKIVTAVGVAQMGEYFMEFHTAMEHLQVSDPEA